MTWIQPQIFSRIKPSAAKGSQADHDMRKHHQVPAECVSWFIEIDHWTSLKQPEKKFIRLETSRWMNKWMNIWTVGQQKCIEQHRALAKSYAWWTYLKSIQKQVSYQILTMKHIYIFMMSSFQLKEGLWSCNNWINSIVCSTKNRNWQ